MSGVGNFFSSLGETLGITRRVAQPQVDRRTGRVVVPGSDTGPGLLGNLANAAGGIGTLIGGPVGGMIGNAVGGLVGGGAGGAQPMGGGAQGGAPPAPPPTRPPTGGLGGALGQLAGVDPSVLLTSLGGQALGAGARAAGLAPEHIAALTNLAQQQNLQAQNQQLEQNQAAVGRAVNNRVTEAINPQLAQITSALQEQRNQTEATAEHRAIVARQDFEREVRENFARINSQLAAANNGIPAPRRY